MSAASHHGGHRMYAPKPARTTHQHPAHMQGRREWQQVYGFTLATAGLIFTAAMFAYGLWHMR